MRILLVDSNQNERIVNRDVLETLGHQVKGVSNEDEAVTILQNEDFEFIITELNLPKTDGLEFIKKISHLKPDTPVIVLTEGVSMSKAIKAVKLRALDVLIKPMDVKKMEKLLSEAQLEKRSIRNRSELDDDIRQKISALQNAVEETQLQFRAANSKMHVLEEIAKQLLRK